MDSEKAIKDLTPTNQVEIAFNIIFEQCVSCDFGNGNKKLVEKFLELLNKQHPTHQQSFARFMIKIIEYYANLYEKNYFDMRNEASCKLFAEMHKISKENPLPFF
jgi:hypothetical protein